MKQETKFETYDGVEVAESPLLRAERGNPYGSVPGLDDEELLNPAEIERLVIKQEFAPILALPEPMARKKALSIALLLKKEISRLIKKTIDFSYYCARIPSKPHFSYRSGRFVL